MARNVKPGITFYRMDSGHIVNKKVRLLFNECGSDGYYIWSCLIDFSYKNFGYYFDLNDPDTLELFATEYCKKDLSLIKKVIQICIKRDLFNKEIAATANVLTSIMMQEIFLFATAERRKKGSAFEIPQLLWLLSPHNLPVNIKILPGGISVTPGRNPQTIDNRQQTKTTEILGPSTDGLSDKNSDKPAKIKKSGGQDARRQKIDPPIYSQVEELFLKQYNPQNPGTWFPDTCRREAADFFDFYEANGWVQGKGRKPIVSWQAAARKWIRTAKTGIYSNNGSSALPVQEKVITPAHQRTSSTNVASREINYLFDKFRDTPDLVTFYSIEGTMYDHLKVKGMILFSEDKVKEIHQLAVDELTRKKIDPTDALIRGNMKRFAVIELFKQYNAAGKTEIFKL